MENTKQSVGEALSLDEIEYEEWLSTSDATFYIRLELNLALTGQQVIAVAKKFNCICGTGREIRIQRGPIVEVCRKIYFPDIPKGWKSLKQLALIYKVDNQILKTWVDGHNLTVQRFNIGLEEIQFAPEKEFRQCVIRQRNRKHHCGVVFHRKPLRKGTRKRNMAPYGFNTP